MATINLGNLTFTHKGDYAGGTAYVKNDVVYYNCNPPFDDLELYEKTEIVYHACEWDKNYLSKETGEQYLQLKQFKLVLNF